MINEVGLYTSGEDGMPDELIWRGDNFKEPGCIEVLNQHQGETIWFASNFPLLIKPAVIGYGGSVVLSGEDVLPPSPRAVAPDSQWSSTTAKLFIGPRLAHATNVPLTHNLCNDEDVTLIVNHGGKDGWEMSVVVGTWNGLPRIKSVTTIDHGKENL